MSEPTIVAFVALALAFAGMGLVCCVQFLMIVSNAVFKSKYNEEIETHQREGFRLHKELSKQFHEEKDCKQCRDHDSQ